VPDFETTRTIRWAAPDDDAARDDVDRWLSQLTPGVDSVLVTPPGAGRGAERIHRPERRPACS
jgi:hypothetical protein